MTHSDLAVLALSLGLLACSTPPASNKGSTPPSEDSASPSEGADGADGTEEDTGEPDPEIQELRLTHDDAKPWVSETYEHVSEGEAELLEDGTLAGTVAFNLRVDGDVACAMEVALDGIPWEGDCIDCDFAFSIDATLLSGEDRSVCADRFLSTFEDLPADEYDGPPVLAFWSSYEPRDIPYTWTDPETGEEITKVIEGGPPVSNVLRAGWLSPLYDGTDRKKFVWHTVAADDSELEGNRATFDGAQLSWNRSYEYTGSYTQPWANICPEGAATAPSSSPILTDAPVYGDLACEYGYSLDIYRADGWTFSAEAGDRFQINLDLVSEDTAFFSWVWVTSPSGCVHSYPDNNVGETRECSYALHGELCPSFELVTDEPGEWTVFVTNYPVCIGDTASYRLDLTRL